MRAVTPFGPRSFLAFQVRHLIEHRNGRIDPQFRAIGQSLWKNSSWGQRITDLPARKKITVIESDLRETASAMGAALEALQAPCVALASRRAES